MPVKSSWQNGEAYNASDQNDIANAVNTKYVKPSSGVPKSDLANDVQTSLGKADTAEQAANKGQANGYAGLDAGGKVPIAQLPSSLFEYQGVWNANTNTPTLVDGTGSAGDVYRVTVAGSRSLGSGVISFAVGDYAIYNTAGVWEKSDTTDAVSTVAGRIGDVVLTAADVRDANGNIVANNHIDGFTEITTSNGTTTLTAASGKILHFVGSANQVLVLPSTGISAGHQFVAINNSTGTISGRSSDSSVIHVLGPSVECLFTALVNNPTLPEHWEDSFYGANFAAGKVLNVNTTLTLAGTDGTSFTFPPANDTVVGIASAQTLTNKRVAPRINSTASSGTPAINTDTTDQFNITALAAAITSMTSGLTGTPTDGQKLLIRIKDNGTARAIAWGTSFVASGAAALPTTTVVNKTHLLGFIYDSTAIKWVCVAADATGY